MMWVRRLVFLIVLGLFLLAACSGDSGEDTLNAVDADAGFGDVGVLDTGVDAEGADAEPDEPPEPSCDDGLQSGDQTDVDCGGEHCPPCDVDQGCEQNVDCVTERCDEGICVDVSCEEVTCDEGLER